jgi:segregation and condensation protein B
VKTLLERNWVRVVGQRDVPGRPELLGTTKDFLDYFGLKRLDELPPLAELKALGDFNLQLALPGEPVPPAATADESAPSSDATPAGNGVDDDGDDDDGDELSAEGGESHELVAAPRDHGD